MNSKIKRTCAFFTFGCKVNQYETQLIREEFLSHGFRETKVSPSFLIVNGCTVTARADKKCKSLLKNLSRKNPEAKIILTGCYAQNVKVLKIELDNISCIIPQDQKGDVFKAVENKFAKQLEDIDDVPELLHKTDEFAKGISGFSSHSRAFVKIQDGCDNFCTYCIVPHMRGKPRSRNLKEIIREVKFLSENGFKEIVLCGINLGTWGEDLDKKLRIKDLIKELNALEDLERLRLSSIELKHVDDSLLEAFAKYSKLCPHLHIPLQSGDSFILKKMHRYYTAAEYLDTLIRIKRQIKDISFTTDIMVGFPGETEVHFNNTLEMVKKAGFTRVHVFPFSVRSGTPAATMPHQVDAKTKRHRRFLLESAAAQTSFAIRKELLEKELSVLFEERVDECWCGYSDTYVFVKVPTSKNLANTIRKVRVTDISLTDTIAKT